MTAVMVAADLISATGMVLDGAIRDVAEIRERTFPVYARGSPTADPIRTAPAPSTCRFRSAA